MFPIEAEKAGTYNPRANSSRTIYYNTKHENGKVVNKLGSNVVIGNLCMSQLSGS